jgi:hypothetical protein
MPLIMSLIEKFLVGSFEEELADCNKMIEQQADVLHWNVTNNVEPFIQANHSARLEQLQSQKRQLISWQEELQLTEAFLNSIIRQ